MRDYSKKLEYVHSKIGSLTDEQREIKDLYEGKISSSYAIDNPFTADAVKFCSNIKGTEEAKRSIMQSAMAADTWNTPGYLDRLKAKMNNDLIKLMNYENI